MARLLEKYKKEIVPALKEELGYKNPLQVPRLEKVVINMGVGEGAHDIKVIEEAMQSLALISGQKPVMTRARKSISNFKIKKGDPVGCKVTLRRERMYEFLDRFINVALPRIRDFRGLSPHGFDENGNYSLGINEYTVFPEIEYDKVQHILGMDITIVVKAKDRRESFLLLKHLGMPFRETE
ncbi:MAG: 50S ribosomal protein L5 [Candidatus Omnitrophica bacterium]|nr:50S ribosomal protein L5 [Candidatus Omnitrophota bacterium]MCM8798083.1 50S ribosomal protein L5 [Candidatus Omnitrophota bacterium]